MTPSWVTVVLGAAAGLLLSADGVFGSGGLRKPASPGYRGRDPCPVSCNVAGPNPSNWSAYHNLDQLQPCQRTLFYSFSLYDEVDDAQSLHRLYACTSYGADWATLPQPAAAAKYAAVIDSVNSTYHLGWWNDGSVLAGADIGSISKQLRSYLKSEHATAQSNTQHTTYLFARSGSASVGLYVGTGLQGDGVGSFALRAVEDGIRTQKINGGTVAMQLCDPDANHVHTFGFFASSNSSFTPVQNAMKTWSQGGCLSFDGSKNITGPVDLITPLEPTVRPSSTPTPSPAALEGRSWTRNVVSRAECTTTQVIQGDTCSTTLGPRCGISAADFIKYNADLCSKPLTPGQHVCCSAGTLPNFAPKPNADGSCSAYTVQLGDNCHDLAAANSITQDDLEKFNKNTWGWNGCGNVWAQSIICLSSGSPPMPAPLANAVCGPQVPGTKKPADTTDIAGLNPCPLNACCDVWGQCGTTDEFCTDTGTGAPGSAAKDTNGCISNCGTQIVRGAAPAEFRSVAYFEGYAFGSRKCLYQDARQVDGSKYTHLHFAFAELTDDYQVMFQDALTTYEFQTFLRISGPKKILSFGGWDFSTQPSTYNIFRQGVKPANRLTMATNIANFVKAQGLDGVDIDWEYPGAPDIPGIPPDDADSGTNYLAFLVVLKNLLAGKSLSIAAPSSYFYLKNYPIETISKIVDYIVYMTYDLHGQWDSGNAWSQVGCPSGNCLRSQVNLTETISSLVMITKAGVPSNKVVVGVTSYGRSFNMADASCYGPNCFFTGGPYDSNATPGECTATGGYIAGAELDDILQDTSRINQQYIDLQSNTNILVYDDTQWVAYMSPEIKAQRTTLYRALNMGGTTDWATDLQQYNDPPTAPGVFVESWSSFKLSIMANVDPLRAGNRSGNWSHIDCDADEIVHRASFTPADRWKGLDANHAWNDGLDYWRQHKSDEGMKFSGLLAEVYNGPENSDCADMEDNKSNCAQTLQCASFISKDSGAAGMAIWNSLVYVHELYATFHMALIEAASFVIDPKLNEFTDKFAPLPAPPDNRWLFLLVDIITFGASMVGSSFFNSAFSDLPAFVGKDFDNSKDTVMSMIGQSTTIAKDLYSSSSTDAWTQAGQDAFGSYISRVFTIWADITQHSVRDLMGNSEDGVGILTKMITNGAFLEGKGSDGEPHEVILTPGLSENITISSDSNNALRDEITRTFYGFAIPAIWLTSGHYPFVIDSGYSCDDQDKHPLSQYLSDENMEALHGCYNSKLYYLAMPDGDYYSCIGGDCGDKKFSAPPGVQYLQPGNEWGNVTVQDIIIGSVRTYITNGNKNTDKYTNATRAGVQDDLLTNGIVAAGFMGLPVCTADFALSAWSQVGGPYTGVDNYPCIPFQSPNFCGDSTFEDQTSDASPLVEDCKGIIANIQGTNGKWEVENAIGSQHQLVQYRTCAFGVQGIGKDGNVDYQIGAQDIVDLITDSISRFQPSGDVIGSKGQMECKGTTKQQTVEWGLYHN